MSVAVEAYTAGGIIAGTLAADARLRETLEAGGSLPFARGIPADDVLAVVDAEADTPIHATWHRIRLDVGPYEIEGDFATLPGFDPGRALTRPSGTFVQLRDAVVRLRGNDAAGANVHPHLLVNRYAVESVGADLMLGFFFPGAAITDVIEAPALPAVGG